MDVFLDRDAFTGPVIEAGAVINQFMGEARFDGYLAFTSWPRAEIEPALPAELTLASSRADLDVHPVVFMFGALRNTTILFGGVAIPTGVEYPEFLMAVPFVRHRRGRNLHTYMARMYSSVRASVFVGNAYYGFAKSLASMCWQGPIFTVTSADESHLLVHAAVERTAQAGGEREPIANLASMREALSLPIVGRRADGSLVASYFDVDFGAGTVEPADSWISLDAPIVTGLSPRRCYDAPSGTVQIRDVIWRLSWPVSCRF